MSRGFDVLMDEWKEGRRTTSGFSLLATLGPSSTVPLSMTLLPITFRIWFTTYVTSEGSRHFSLLSIFSQVNFFADIVAS